MGWNSWNHFATKVDHAIMRAAALEATGRPIVYSLCEYGNGDVGEWGALVRGNLWRTTGDIADTWKSMQAIDFSQAAISSYTKAGHWNDPDMFEVGNGGMTEDLWTGPR